MLLMPMMEPPGRVLAAGHLARGGLHGVEGAVEVGAGRAVVQGGVEVEEVGKRADAGVADAHVEPAGAEGVQRRRHEARARGRVAHVAGHVGQRARRRVGRAHRRRFREQRLEVRSVARQVEVVDRHAAALAQELEADGPADARGAAGDDGRLALEQVERRRHGWLAGWLAGGLRRVQARVSGSYL